MERTAALEIVGLRKSFGDHCVLDGIDLVVESGTIFALLGPNGAGKTTTIRILSTLTAADAGTAHVAGFDVEREAAQVRRSISLTGQSAAVDEFLTGEENLRMIGQLLRLPATLARTRATELLAQFGLADAAGRRVSTYSGGMRRRLDLAASLVRRPPVIFLDEPTTGLDPVSRQGLWRAVSDLAAEGCTIFLTTQYLEEADQLADRIGVIDDGRIVAVGTADELKRRVSGGCIELQFPTADEYTAALELLADLDVAPDDSGLVLRVAGEDTTGCLAEVFDRLRESNVRLGDIEILRPTLDDVFIALTTKEAA